MIASSIGSTHASATALLHAWTHQAPPGQAAGVATSGAVVAGEITTVQQSLLDALAPLVGMTTEELQSTLESGQPLESLAAQYGIDLSALSDKLETTTGLLLDVKA